jgi:hypothetical protein
MNEIIFKSCCSDQNEITVYKGNLWLDELFWNHLSALEFEKDKKEKEIILKFKNQKDFYKAFKIIIDFEKDKRR